MFLFVDSASELFAYIAAGWCGFFSYCSVVVSVIGIESLGVGVFLLI